MQSAWNNFKTGFHAKADRKPSTSTNDDVFNRAAHYVGRVAGDVATDQTRGGYWFWNYPLGAAQGIGTKLGKDINDDPNYKGNKINPRFIGAALSLGVLPILSGNFDPTNLSEFGRPKGYKANFPDYEDPTKTTNPAMEFLSRYFLGRQGTMLQFPEFHKERPDVTPEQYQNYKNSTGFTSKEFFGLEKHPTESAIGLGTLAAGVVGARTRRIAPTVAALAGGAFVGNNLGNIASTGLIRGTVNGLDGQPVIQQLGYSVPLSALAGTIGAGLALRYGIPALHRYQNPIMYRKAKVPKPTPQSTSTEYYEQEPFKGMEDFFPQ